MPEAEALDILLRPVSGFIAAPRPVQTATLSRFDRIVVMPTIAAPRAPVPAAAAAAPQPAFTPPQPPPFPGDDEADPNGQAQRPPVFNTFPQPQVVYPGTNPTLTPNQPGVNGNVPQQYRPERAADWKRPAAVTARTDSRSCSSRSFSSRPRRPRRRPTVAWPSQGWSSRHRSSPEPFNPESRNPEWRNPASCRPVLFSPVSYRLASCNPASRSRRRRGRGESQAQPSDWVIW